MWHKLSEEKPNSDERIEYLVAIKGFGTVFYELACWSNNLSRVDKYDFPVDEYGNKSGFYQHDNEWGYVELADVVAWMDFETYKGDIND